MTHDTYRDHDDAQHTARVNALLDKLAAMTAERDRAVRLASDCMDAVDEAQERTDEAMREAATLRLALAHIRDFQAAQGAIKQGEEAL